jgi:hypothetical protein
MPRRIRTETLQATGETVSLDGYFDRVIKYIPSDIVGGWLAVTGIIKSLNTNDTNTGSVQWIAFAVGALLTLAWTWRQTEEPSRPTAILQIVISTAAFVVWVAAVGGPFTTLTGYKDYYGSLLLIGFTLASGLATPKS